MSTTLKQILSEHMDLVPKLFEFLEQAETYNFGGAGSGNWGHEGRPGEVGGSSGDGGGGQPSLLQQVESRMAKEAAIKDAVARGVHMLKPENRTPERIAEIEHFARVRLAQQEAAKAAETPKVVEAQKPVDKEVPKPEIVKEAPKAIETPRPEIVKKAPKPTQNELKILEEKSDKLIDKFDKAGAKSRNSIIAKENSVSENKESLKYLETSKKLNEEELRTGIDRVLGDGVSKNIDIQHLADVHASIEHNISIIGEKAYKESVSSIKSVSKEFIDQHGSLGDSVLAAYSPSTKEIFINRDKTGLEHTSKSIEDSKKEYGTNFHARSGNPYSLKNSIDHETGHAIFHGTTSRDSKEKIGEVFDKAGRYTLSSLISKYSAYTVDELSAEAWSSNLNNGSANSIVKNITALMGDLR